PGEFSATRTFPVCVLRVIPGCHVEGNLAAAVTAGQSSIGDRLWTTALSLWTRGRRACALCVGTEGAAGHGGVTGRAAMHTCGRSFFLGSTCEAVVHERSGPPRSRRRSPRRAGAGAPQRPPTPHRLDLPPRRGPADRDPRDLQRPAGTAVGDQDGRPAGPQGGPPGPGPSQRRGAAADGAGGQRGPSGRARAPLLGDLVL